MTDVSPSIASCISDMASEILALRARLAAVEAEMVRMGRDHTVRLQVRDEEENALRARLAAVEALCDAASDPGVKAVSVADIRAAARGEGDR